MVASVDGTVGREDMNRARIDQGKPLMRMIRVDVKEDGG